jgi:RNA polymerase sigma factor (TIGR02999 family)
LPVDEDWISFTSETRERVANDDIADPGTGGDVLSALRSGQRDSLDRLVALVYQELRVIAHRRLGRHRRAGQKESTLATTALVNEAYLKLVDQSQARWTDRAHFLALAAVAMRHILIDRAKARVAQKRGGDRPALTLDEGVIADDSPEALLDINEALERLAEIDPRLARVVEYRFFGGLSEEEIAEVLGVTRRTVQRDWTKARMLLRRELGP